MVDRNHSGIITKGELVAFFSMFRGTCLELSPEHIEKALTLSDLMEMPPSSANNSAPTSPVHKLDLDGRDAIGGSSWSRGASPNNAATHSSSRHPRKHNSNGTHKLGAAELELNERYAKAAAEATTGSAYLLNPKRARQAISAAASGASSSSRLVDLHVGLTHASFVRLLMVLYSRLYFSPEVTHALRARMQASGGVVSNRKSIDDRCMYIHTCIHHTFIFSHIQTYTHTYIHTYTHTS
jgi:hypothetical protein